MTNKEAIEWIKSLIETMLHETSVGPFPDPEFRDEVYEALDMAIKALEQDPVLDKIRSEIENDWQLKKYPSSPFSCGLRRAIEIIDKYKAESEEK